MHEYIYIYIFIFVQYTHRFALFLLFMYHSIFLYITVYIYTCIWIHKQEDTYMIIDREDDVIKKIDIDMNIPVIKCIHIERESLWIYIYIYISIYPFISRYIHISRYIYIYIPLYISEYTVLKEAKVLKLLYREWLRTWHLSFHFRMP